MDTSKDFLLRAVSFLTEPVQYPIMGMQRIYWQYIVTAVLIALLVYLVGFKEKRSLRGFLAFCFPRSVFLHPSARDDYWYFLVNRLLNAMLIIPFVATIAVLPELLVKILSLLTGKQTLAFVTEEQLWVVFAYTALLALALDFGVFLAHYLMHRIRFLWEFHKVHHSAEVLTPLTVYRTHPVDDLLTLSSAATCIAVSSALFRFFVYNDSFEYVVLGLNAFVFLFYLFGYNLRHSHIWLSYGRWLSHFFISPAQHQVHHSDNPRHFDKNMGFILAIWDWLFGTLYIPDKNEAGTLSYGLGPAETTQFRGIRAKYVLPFTNNYLLFKRRRKRRRQL